MRFRIFESLLLEDTDKVYSQYYNYMPRDEFDRIVAIDPTFRPNEDKTREQIGNYGKWLLKLNKDGENLSDIKDINAILTLFNDNKHKFPSEYRDIGRFKSIKQLKDYLDTSVDVDKTNIEKNLEDGELHIKPITKNREWSVWSPKTFAESRAIRNSGNGAVWCTGYDDNRSYWDSYTDNDGKLFIFQKRDETIPRPTNKYQVAVYSNGGIREFRDSANNAVGNAGTGKQGFIKFLNDNPSLRDLLINNEYISNSIDAIKEVKLQMDMYNGKTYVYNGDDISSNIKPYIKKVDISNDINEISTNAFRDCTEIETLVIPGNITYVGMNAFRDCKSLKEVTFEEGLLKIDGYAFDGCTSLKTVKLPLSITSIEHNAFRNCSENLEIIMPKHKVSVSASDARYILSHLTKI